MNASETAHAFTALLKSGQHIEAGDQFNAEDIVSYEAMGPMQVCKGRAAVKAKGDWWYANHEIHSATTTGPYVNGDQFVVEFEMDVTMKTTSQRIQMREIGLYTVRDGKIAEERFFYAEG
ncbi:MAG: nuclear transport factor 2 family protein [Alphaproteobacteria bacterium]